MASVRTSPGCTSARLQGTLRAHPLRPQRIAKHLHPQHRPLASASGAGAAPQESNAGGPEGFFAKMLGENEYSMQFRLRRWFLFSGLVLGYSFYYLCRNSLNYVNPVMVADPTLGLGMTEVAAMTSIFPIAYGASKFVSGVLGARTSPRLLLAIGLMCTASVNILFGFSSSLVWFCVLWAINGTLQGFGGPSCARMLTTWFASKERGTYWGLWNIAHNLGGFLAPIIAGFAAREFGWRWGMWVPGIMGIFMGFYVLLSTADSPEAKGYPPVEVLEPEEDKTGDKEDAEPVEKPSMIQVLIKTVLKNPYIWGMALTYFFIYVIRQGVTSWSIFYLLKVKGVANAAQAAFMVSGLEVGGLAGSLLAGRIADAMVNNAKDPINEGNVGKRVQVVMAYTVGIAGCLVAFQLAPAGVWALQWAIVFLLGFFIYGPQMLIGLCGAELVGPESVGASEGFLGWVAYLGAANAGIPLSIIVKQYGWSAYFSTLIGACVGALILLSPMVNLKSHVQREKARLLARDTKAAEAAAAAAAAAKANEGTDGPPAAGTAAA